MKIYPVLIFIHSVLPLTVQASNWKLARQTNNIKIWLHNSNPHITGSLEIKTNTNRRVIKEKSFLKKFKNRRRKIHSLIGVYNWQASDYQWFTKKNYHQLNISGSYFDFTDKKILFDEVHIFKDNRLIQMLHTRPIQVKNGKELSKEIMEYMKKRAWN
ncbi:MAG: hypothetical protein OXB84_05735 [Halobacteriovoraceae bacterium]|nr:hypothetical protein [Halobacteriovoraceae bacterium]